MRQALHFDFVRFGLVGASGFLLNLAILTFLHKLLGVPVFVAQLIGAEIALFSNFILHDRWTYKRNNVTKALSQLLVQFHLTSWVAIIGSALLVSFFVNVMHLSDFIALVISSVIAMGWNFATSKFYVWRHEHQPKESKEES